MFMAEAPNRLHLQTLMPFRVYYGTATAKLQRMWYPPSGLPAKVLVVYCETQSSSKDMHETSLPCLHCRPIHVMPFTSTGALCLPTPP